ncbi:SMAD/FHA domain-containing protein [Crucibulum laeve]|uniref:SMAD/FHA domain-containing protein n=1 Tax=Crucibulum laeve TaxID=68775 RepID=A0A5C3M727_9AGAR|nr:SMAD/FHA domain-containing protein [Crucibulum laeve]
MPRDSRSPPRYRSRREEDSRGERRDSGYANGNFSRDKRRTQPDSKSGRYNSREDVSSNRDRERNSRREDNRRRPDDERYGYGEQERERERQRDRERYDGRREREREGEGHSSRSQRRSASPPSRTSRPRSSRPESRPGSREPSPEDKAKPNFAPSGLLAAETNTVKAIDGTKTVLKYNEPPEARKPVLGWRLYVFKGSEQVELLHIHRQSAYLIGRDRLVADIPIEHPSCSKQHAVIQYRYVQEKNEFGDTKGVVKPFIIDLESTNGTHVNDAAIPPARYYELKASDIIKFGQSTREYVLLHDEAS